MSDVSFGERQRLWLRLAFMAAGFFYFFVFLASAFFVLTSTCMPSVQTSQDQDVAYSIILSR